jgi:hypothetical protein
MTTKFDLTAFIIQVSLIAVCFLCDTASAANAATHVRGNEEEVQTVNEQVTQLPSRSKASKQINSNIHTVHSDQHGRFRTIQINPLLKNSW